MMTLTTGTATKRASTGTTTETTKWIDGDKRQAFINHTMTKTSIEPTHTQYMTEEEKTLLTVPLSLFKRKH